MHQENQASQDVQPARMERAAQLCARYGISKSALYKWLKEEDRGFPQPIKYGAKCTLFNVAAVDDYFERVRSGAVKVEARKAPSEPLH